MLDPILRLSVSRQQGSYYLHAIGLAVPTIRGAVVNDGADLEFLGHLSPHPRSPVAPYLGGKEVGHHRHPRRSQNCSFDGKGVPTAPKIVGRKFKFNMGVPSSRGSARY